MLSKARIKFIKSLQVKKYRKQEQCFVVQGAKSVQELLRSDFETIFVAGTADFLRDLPGTSAELVEASEKDLALVGEFQSNDAGLAVARMRPNDPIPPDHPSITLVLDDIRDPGNLGTIIRTADWYGITHVVSSLETADIYNPKVISSTMGSFTRVKIYYTGLPEFLATTALPVYGCFLQGEDVHATNFAKACMIVIGNESRGISEEVEKFISKKITIPQIGKAESLNAAIATAIVLDNAVHARR